MSDNNKPASFIDSMDPSRVLRPVEVKGRLLVCKVFFREGKEGKTLSYAGKTTLPARLFDSTDRRNSYIGFVEPFAPGAAGGDKEGAHTGV